MDGSRTRAGSAPPTLGFRRSRGTTPASSAPGGVSCARSRLLRKSLTFLLIQRLSPPGAVHLTSPFLLPGVVWAGTSRHRRRTRRGQLTDGSATDPATTDGVRSVPLISNHIN